MGAEVSHRLSRRAPHFVVPELDLVVVLTAGHPDNAALAWVAVDILNRYALAAVK
jgi:hypothetical protein